MMTISTILLPTAKQMLQSLSGQLRKAAGFVADGDGTEAAMMDVQLAPDMFPLSKQIAFACVQPVQALARLRGEALSDTESVTTFDEAQALIARTLATLEGADAAALDAAADQPITMNLPNGMTFTLNGAEYVRDWTLPQFYFHLMAAYALLRHIGVAIGKADYVGHMARYAVRP